MIVIPNFTIAGRRASITTVSRSDHRRRAATSYHAVAPLPIKRKRPPERRPHSLASVIERQRE